MNLVQCSFYLSYKKTWKKANHVLYLSSSLFMYLASEHIFFSKIKCMSTMRKGIKITFVFNPSSYLFYSVPSFIPLFRTNINRIMVLILIFFMEGLEALPHPSPELWPPVHTNTPGWASYPEYGVWFCSVLLLSSSCITRQDKTTDTR